MPLQSLKKANGEEIVSVGDVVSHSVRGALHHYDVATQAPSEEIPRTSHLIVNSDGSLNIHTMMRPYVFLRQEGGFIYKNGAEHALDPASNKILESLLQARTIVYEKVRDKRRSYVG